MKKKVLALFLAAVLAASFSACSGADHNSSKIRDDKPVISADKDSTTDKTDEGFSEDSSENSKTSSAGQPVSQSSQESSSSSANSSHSDNSGNSSSVNSSKPSSNENSSSSKPNGDSCNSGNSASSSKPSTGSSSSSSGNTKPSTGSSSSKPNSKPSTGDSSSSSSSSKPAHQHNYSTVVSSTKGDCSHKGTVTKKCSCGATITVDGNFGSHNWKDCYKDVYHEAVTNPVYDYAYICNECGAQFNDEQTCGEHCIFDCDSTYTYKEWVDHYETVTPAWTERVPDGKECTICGKHQN